MPVYHASRGVSFQTPRVLGGYTEKGTYKSECAGSTASVVFPSTSLTYHEALLNLATARFRLLLTAGIESVHNRRHAPELAALGGGPLAPTFGFGYRPVLSLALSDYLSLKSKTPQSRACAGTATPLATLDTYPRYIAPRLRCVGPAVPASQNHTASKRPPASQAYSFNTDRLVAAKLPCSSSWT